MFQIYMFEYFQVFSKDKKYDLNQFFVAASIRFILLCAFILSSFVFS